MNNKIKTAFDSVHADDKLKQNTKDFIHQQLNSTQHSRNTFYMNFKGYLAVACSLFMIIIIGGFSFFTPISVISVDVNPSLELSINCFDQVVSAKGFNDDGIDLLKSVDLKYKSYTEAIDILMQEYESNGYLENDGLVSITVLSTTDEKSEEMLSHISSHHYADDSNMTYHEGHHEYVESAHDAGLSFGKYQAYLKLKDIEPDVTTEDVQNMTMRQIHNIIGDCNGNSNNGSCEMSSQNSSCNENAENACTDDSCKDKKTNHSGHKGHRNH